MAGMSDTPNRHGPSGLRDVYRYWRWKEEVLRAYLAYNHRLFGRDEPAPLPDHVIEKKEG
jgi:hypothetical protein